MFAVKFLHQCIVHNFIAIFACPTLKFSHGLFDNASTRVIYYYGDGQLYSPTTLVSFPHFCLGGSTLRRYLSHFNPTWLHNVAWRTRNNCSPFQVIHVDESCIAFGAPHTKAMGTLVCKAQNFMGDIGIVLSWNCL